MVNIQKIKEAENFLSHIVLSRKDTMPISEIVEMFRPVLSGSDYQFDLADFDYLIRSLETRFVTSMQEGVSLIDDSLRHDNDWCNKRDIDQNYWQDYESHLIDQRWSPRVISSMNSVTSNILGLLQDPLKDGEWERRGLVIGHVQSGKTANYIGLITKAADAGYKFIIVIAGIHNNLRTQTQERIDVGFIGRDSKTKQLIGVGLRSPNRAMPVTVTTTESDFNKTLAKSIGMELNSFSKTFILVIKKSAPTLTSLYDWLKKLNTRSGTEKITDIPMLLIDDEADNASINTNEPDLDPTKINREIRSILNLFRKRCYVGYTATPFANIFIDPDDNNKVLGNNLFPAHFIYSLDAPSNYFGAEKIFLDESSSFVKDIDDIEQYIPLRHKKDFSIESLPPTLLRAIRLFILARAIRNIRGQTKKHCSMLINISRFVDVQRDVKQLTIMYVDEIKKAIRFNYAFPVERAIADETIAEFYKDFEDEYDDAEVEWKEVLAELNNAADVVKVFVINSKSDEPLDYATYTKEGNALTAIAIGGLSLSRGLTIEGLTISYVYRNSKMYDTLMQMGRWFGYRDNYEDLCRIFMSGESVAWYSHIAEATEELRMQIKHMSRAGKNPSDFGLYVRAHPDTLIVTALNKMRYADNRIFKISFAGKLLETHIIPSASVKNNHNRDLIKTLFDQLRTSQPPFLDDTSYLFRDISWKQVYDFISQFDFHEDLVNLKESVPKFIKEVSDLHPAWDVAYQSLKRQTPEDGYMVAAQVRSIGIGPDENPRIPPSEPGWYVGNKNKVSGNSMFEIGLSVTGKLKAKANAIKYGRLTSIYHSDFTDAREKPLLLIHLLNLVRDKKNKTEEPIIKFVPALSISFPNSDEFRTVEYVVGPVWLRQFEQDRFDSPGDEDDYDLYQ